MGTVTSVQERATGAEERETPLRAKILEIQIYLAGVFSVGACILLNLKLRHSERLWAPGVELQDTVCMRLWDCTYPRKILGS